MQHQIPINELGPQGHEMAQAVEQCVHCGFCLSTCPTYKVMGEEMDSPRGRIFLMKEQLEGNLELDETAPFIDRCLGCMACVTSCPSGVEYGDLLSPFRARLEADRTRKPMERLTRLLVRETLPYPGRFRAAATVGRWAKPWGRMLPDALSGMLSLLPDQVEKARPLPARYPAIGQRRARVLLLAGCVQQVLSPEINWATLRVLAQNGVEVLIPPRQGCCGSLAMHTGEEAQAKMLARKNLPIFLDEADQGTVDAIITNAAGCGSGMKEYGQLFKGTADEDRAHRFSSRVQDVTTFLDQLGLVDPAPLPNPLTVAYHDACHLAHAQGVKSAPRRILSAIPNLTLVEIPEGDLCCGSAGTYNLEQPDLAWQIGERKAKNILATGADLIAMGNIGCMTQIETHLAALGKPLSVVHTIELLDQAYRSDL